MKRIFYCLTALLFMTRQSHGRRIKRAYEESFPVEYPYTFFQDTLSVDLPNIPLQTDLTKPQITPILSNSLEKPVQEPQDVNPPQNANAVIPLMPPPATPVNAAASNVPQNAGAVFLGSGSLAVVDLGGGAYVLGSGGLGYSDNRRQPRPSGKSPLYPPLPAAPNLIPAAVPNYQLPAIPFPSNDIGFDQPLFNPSQQQPKLVNQDGYEQLSPNQVTFGMVQPRYRRVKATPAYATPTVTQINTEYPQPGQMPMPGFGDPVPQLAVAPPTPNLQQMPPQQPQPQQPFVHFHG